MKKLMKLAKGTNFCCELCGKILVDKCYNDNGFLTHKSSCMSYATDEELKELGLEKCTHIENTINKAQSSTIK